jgi:tetratricopeptide (TPR) repeat protein
LEIRLRHPLARLGFLAVSALALGFLLLHAFYGFIVGTLADTRLAVSPGTLVNPLTLVPDSPRLNARLAEAELAARSPDLDRAEASANRACALVPWNYRYQITRARVRVARNDLEGAEEAFREAKRLAPANREVRYKFANLLVREGKLIAALEEFRTALAGGSQMLASTLDLIWRVSGGNAQAVEYVAGDDAKTRVEAALFLLNQKKVADAARVFGEIDPSDRLMNPRSAQFLDQLVAAGEFRPAKNGWLEVTGSAAELISNGGFEADIYQQFGQFDWVLTNGENSRVNIETDTAHQGSRSVRLSFVGSAARAETYLRQLLLLKPGINYRLEFFARSDRLASAEGPLVTISDPNGQVLAESTPMGAGSSDWQLFAVDFKSIPSGALETPVYINVQSRGKGPGPGELRGSVQFDDFRLQELPVR